MARSYRKNRPIYHTKGRGHKASFAWGWLLTGMFVGVLAASTAYMVIVQKWSLEAFKQLNRLSLAKRNLSDPTKPPTPKPTLQKKESAPQFEFYTLLPGMEVPLPDPTLHPTTRTSSPPVQTLTTQSQASTTPTPTAKIPSKTLNLPKTPPHKPFRHATYVIQTGVFRNSKTAEVLKARLALQGLKAKIQKIEAEDGFWFRVTLGPYPTEALALKHKQRLVTQKIPAILVLQRQSN